MAKIPVFVLETAQGVAARESFKNANRGNTVEWDFSANQGTFEVELTGFLPAGSPLNSAPQPLPRDLFSSPLAPSLNGVITGTIDQGAPDGVYFYHILKGGKILRWMNPISAFHEFGGVQIPDPPGGGGGR
jgi:hypothetical protein